MKISNFLLKHSDLLVAGNSNALSSGGFTGFGAVACAGVSLVEDIDNRPPPINL